MVKWKDPKDIERIKRVRARLIAKGANVIEPPPKPVLTIVPKPIPVPPLQENDAFMHDGLTEDVPRETLKSTVEHKGHKYERGDDGGMTRTELKPKQKSKSAKKKKKDKNNR